MKIELTQDGAVTVIEQKEATPGVVTIRSGGRGRIGPDATGHPSPDRAGGNRRAQTGYDARRHGPGQRMGCRAGRTIQSN